MVQDPFIGPQHLPDEGEEVYVGWMDLMGIGDAMSRSYPSAATNVGKLFAAVANHRHIDEVDVYPMVDGLYLLGEVEDDDTLYVATIMSNIFRQFGNLTNHRNENRADNYGPWLGFLLRGGIAYGHVYHGSDVDEDGESDLADNNWMDNVPFGEPIANAHNEERGLAPYAIGVHDSATSTDQNWKWWESYDDDTKENIVNYLQSHFKWCKKNIGTV